MRSELCTQKKVLRCTAFETQTVNRWANQKNQLSQSGKSAHCCNVRNFTTACAIEKGCRKNVFSFQLWTRLHVWKLRLNVDKNSEFIRIHTFIWAHHMEWRKSVCAKLTLISSLIFLIYSFLLFTFGSHALLGPRALGQTNETGTRKVRRIRGWK